MLAPNYSANKFHGVITNGGGQPSGTVGTSITPGNNTFPAYAQVLSATAFETFFCVVHAHANDVAAQARNTLLNIGIDPAGGSTYVTRIPNLLVACAVTMASLGGGVFYGFPLYIPAGATLAAQASINNATVGTLRCVLRLFGRPSRPESLVCGSYIDSFGEATSTSTGTEVTPGTTSDGAYTQLGSNTAKPYWWWQTGFGANDSTLGSNQIVLDLAYGDATNQHLISGEIFVALNASSEAIAKPLHIVDAVAPVPAGVGIFGRMQASALQANHQMIAYGLG